MIPPADACDPASSDTLVATFDEIRGESVPERRRRATSADVAARAGVSRTTDPLVVSLDLRPHRVRGIVGGSFRG
jgi:hypothetical protein